MHYSCVVLAVKDIQRSKQFYQELFSLEIYQDYGINIAFEGGLSLQQEFDWLTGLPKEQILQQSNNFELCFEEENFDEFLNKLTGYPHLTYLGGVIEQRWGQRTVRFYDPDGHLIEVGECIKTVIKRFLSQGMSMEEVSKRMDASIGDLEKLMAK